MVNIRGGPIFSVNCGISREGVYFGILFKNQRIIGNQVMSVGNEITLDQLIEILVFTNAVIHLPHVEVQCQTPDSLVPVIKKWCADRQGSRVKQIGMIESLDIGGCLPLR